MAKLDLSDFLPGKFTSIDHTGNCEYKFAKILGVTTLNEKDAFVCISEDGATTVENLSTSDVFFDTEAAARKQVAIDNGEVDAEAAPLLPEWVEATAAA